MYGSFSILKLVALYDRKLWRKVESSMGRKSMFLVALSVSCFFSSLQWLFVDGTICFCILD